MVARDQPLGRGSPGAGGDEDALVAALVDGENGRVGGDGGLESARRAPSSPWAAKYSTIEAKETRIGASTDMKRPRARSSPKSRAARSCSSADPAKTTSSRSVCETMFLPG